MFVTAGRATASVLPSNTPPSAEAEIFFGHYARDEQCFFSQAFDGHVILIRPYAMRLTSRRRCGVYSAGTLTTTPHPTPRSAKPRYRSKALLTLKTEASNRSLPELSVGWSFFKD